MEATEALRVGDGGDEQSDVGPVISCAARDRIAEWVLHTACAKAAEWERTGHKLRIGVNLSPSQFRPGDLATSVAYALTRSGLSPTSLELEVTEDILLHDEQSALNTFLKIQALGVRLVFDDFGTGFASLSYLKKFPLDGLKIDRSFVLGLLANPDDAAIVSSTIGLSKQLGLSVIAEGIEDSATGELLGRHDLDGRPRRKRWLAGSRRNDQHGRASLDARAVRQNILSPELGLL